MVMRRGLTLRQSTWLPCLCRGRDLTLSPGVIEKRFRLISFLMEGLSAPDLDFAIAFSVFLWGESRGRRRVSSPSEDN